MAIKIILNQKSSGKQKKEDTTGNTDKTTAVAGQAGFKQGSKIAMV